MMMMMSDDVTWSSALISHPQLQQQDVCDVTESLRCRI